MTSASPTLPTYTFSKRNVITVARNPLWTLYAWHPSPFIVHVDTERLRCVNVADTFDAACELASDRQSLLATVTGSTPFLAYEEGLWPAGDLPEEAAALCRRLYLAQLAETAKRDEAGRRMGDARRIERLEQLRRRAADRWRRRAGFAELTAAWGQVKP